MLRKLDNNSVLYIKSIDRLGRSYRDLSDQWRVITKEKGADVVVIDMPKWAFNYESGEYEDIDREGFSWTRGEYTYNWDDSEYRREEEEERQQMFDDDDDLW